MSNKLNIRLATLADIPGISALVERVYPSMPPYPKDMLRGQINAFPEGVWVAELDEAIRRLLRHDPDPARNAR